MVVHVKDNLRMGKLLTGKDLPAPETVLSVRFASIAALCSSASGLQDGAKILR